jgi:hypothetical protein
MKRRTLLPAVAVLFATFTCGLQSFAKSFTVRAMEEISFKATLEKGSVSGKIPKETHLEVLGVEGDNLKVRFRQLTTTVPKAATDFGTSPTSAGPTKFAGIKTKQALPDVAKRTFTKEELDSAYYSARNGIRGVLKAPSTAKFSNLQLDPDTGATPDDAGRIICKGYVEGQNSFGVPLRQRWVVWVQPEGKDQWRAVYAVLDGNILRDDRTDHKTEQVMSAEKFLGMRESEVLRLMGDPIDVHQGNNSADGAFKVYSFSKQKGKETFFTIWASDGVISGGMYQGVSFGQ